MGEREGSDYTPEPGEKQSRQVEPSLEAGSSSPAMGTGRWINGFIAQAARFHRPVARRN